MSGDGLIRVRIARGYRMVDESAGVTAGYGVVVAVPSELAREWLQRGWADPAVEAPGDPAA